MRLLRVGRISALNMYPIYHGLERAEDPTLEFTDGVPTALNAALLEGRLDVSAVSSIAFARNADRLRLVPVASITADGAVNSIQVFSRVPFEEIRTVAVTPHSATSVALLRILLDDGVAPFTILDRPPAEALERGRRRPADRRRGARRAARALRPPPHRPGRAVAGAHRPPHGVRRVGRVRGGGAGAPRRPRRAGGPPHPRPLGLPGRPRRGGPGGRRSASPSRPSSSAPTCAACATSSGRPSARGSRPSCAWRARTGQLAAVPRLAA